MLHSILGTFLKSAASGLGMAALLLFCSGSMAYGVGQWLPVTGAPDSIGICLLLPDGTVLAEGSNNSWWKLTPGADGHYTNGIWTARQSSSWGHQSGSTAVLQNGKVFIAGGENGNGTNQVEIYDPGNDSWKVAVSAASFGNIYDGNAMLLANGQVLIAPQGQPPLVFNGDSATYTFNPANNQISPTVGAPLDGLGESTWVKLPDDDIVAINSGNSATGTTTAEQYDPSTGIWTDAVTGGAVPNIWPNVTGSGAASEMGPSLLLPNGSAIFFGGNGSTAVDRNGVWSQSATIPNGLAMKDAPGAMMFNGKILLAVSPPGLNSYSNNINGIGPTSFYEYDYTANGGAGGYQSAPSPVGGISGAAYPLSFLDLSDGTVLLSPGGTNLYVYQPDGSPLAAGQPAISSVSDNADGSLHLTGTLFNGISQGASYGDDAQMDSNFPLARFTSGSMVYFGSTYNWSSTGVQTGSKIVTTECTLPAIISQDSPGTGYALQVVANGIASAPVTVYGPVWVDFNYSPSSPQVGTYTQPFSTLAQGTNAVPVGGTIRIKPGHSPETMTITKAMTLTAAGGSAVIGD